MGKVMERGSRNKEGKKIGKKMNEVEVRVRIMFIYHLLAVCICSLRVTELNENLKCLSDFGIYLNSLCDITMFRALEKNTGALEKWFLAFLLHIRDGRLWFMNSGAQW